MQYGHFDNKSREYVIDRVDLPVSWTNYIGVGDMYGVQPHGGRIPSVQDPRIPPHHAFPPERRADGRPRALYLHP